MRVYVYVFYVALFVAPIAQYVHVCLLTGAWVCRAARVLPRTTGRTNGVIRTRGISYCETADHDEIHILDEGASKIRSYRHMRSCHGKTAVGASMYMSHGLC